MEKLGTDYGGWNVPLNMKLDENSIVYSGGVGEDMSFDIKLQAKYNCRIILIDPTKKSIRHFNEVKECYRTKKFYFSGNIQKDYLIQIQNESPDLDKFEYLEIGLWNKKDKLRFYKQINENYVSQSLIPNMFGTTYDEVSVSSIKDIMLEKGHRNIDLLKLDIEGSEINVLNQMLEDYIFPKYILVEFDLLLKHKDQNNSTKNIIQSICKNGYVIVANDNYNITFVKT